MSEVHCESVRNSKEILWGSKGFLSGAVVRVLTLKAWPDLAGM